MLHKLEKDAPEVGYLYCGGRVDWEYGWYTWIGPNYEAEWNSEDGWISNGQKVQARTLKELAIEVDDFIESYPHA